MEAIATFPALQAAAPPRRSAKRQANPAWLVSLCLHLGLFLLLIWAVPHQQGASLPKKSITLIALQTLQAAPAPSASASVAPPSPPRHHPRAATAKPAAAPTWQTPPAPLPTPPPALAQAPGPAADPAPEAPPAPTEVAVSEPSPAPPSAAGSSAQNSFFPLAYLTQVSRIINYNVHQPDMQRHGMSVAVVHISLDRDGTVLGAGVIQSSGYRERDEEALAVIERIHKFPAPPGDNFPFNIDQPIRFRDA